MNIYAAYVTDRRAINKRPVLTIVIDSMPVASNPIVRRLDWTSAKYGPLIEFTCGDDAGLVDLLKTELSPAAHFNLTFADSLAPVVDVRVKVKPVGVRDDPGAYAPLDGYWALQLRRARSVLKRFDIPYRLVMSDWEGTRGRPGWVPVPIEPKCDAEFLLDPVENQCNNAGTEHVSLKGIDYWLCMDHLASHHAKHFAARHRN